MRFALFAIGLLICSLRAVGQDGPAPGVSQTQWPAPTATPQWRPLYHFSPPANWTNDPNGLIFPDGKFNLYFQHNPFENKWGHMSWGHATSTDPVNWNSLAVAIPETMAAASMRPSPGGMRRVTDAIKHDYT